MSEIKLAFEHAITQRHCFVSHRKQLTSK